jgi:hypothetical protein
MILPKALGIIRKHGDSKKTKTFVISTTKNLTNTDIVSTLALVILIRDLLFTTR